MKAFPHRIKSSRLQSNSMPLHRSSGHVTSRSLRNVSFPNLVPSKPLFSLSFSNLILSKPFCICTEPHYSFSPRLDAFQNTASPMLITTMLFGFCSVLCRSFSASNLLRCSHVFSHSHHFFSNPWQCISSHCPALLLLLRSSCILLPARLLVSVAIAVVSRLSHFLSLLRFS